MLKNRFSFIVVAAGCIFSVQHSFAGPLTSAEVTKIINRVSVIDPAKGGHPAILRDIIKDDLGLQTGAKSRSELLFQDNTLTRIGAETFFSFKTGTRDLTLEKGSMLLQVPKGLGGAKIHTAAVTGAITGTTIMMEYAPGRYIKVLVLEGSLRLSRNGTFSHSLLLRPGKMVIMRPDAKEIPDPIDVDLARIVKTSTLVNFPGGDTLPSMPLIEAAINDQAKELATGVLVSTHVLVGHGTNVILASDDQLAKTVGRAGLGSVNAAANVGLSGNGSPTVSAGTVPTSLLGQPPVGTNLPTAVSSGSLGGQIPAVPPPLGPGH
jgi:FecR protein